METNELRIGNWVNHNSNWCYRGEDVYEFQWDDRDWYALGECTLMLEDIEPIPLTEEWLLKFGFELHPKNNFHIDLYVIKIKPDTENQLIISIGFKDKSWNMFNGINDAWCNTLNINKIKYVHQLQNLFFALTGEELQTPVVKVE